MIDFKKILKESEEELGLDIPASGEGPSPVGEVPLDTAPAVPQDVPPVDQTPPELAVGGVDPRLLGLHIEEGMGLVTEIVEKTSALPVFINFPERSLILFFPSSKREETFSFDEAKDLLMSIEGFEKKSAPKAKKPDAGTPDVTEDEEMTGAVPDENSDAYQNALNKVNTLMQTPDDKLASISDETGVDLIAAKKQAAGIIQKKTMDDLNSLKAAAAAVQKPAPTAGGSTPSSTSTGSTANTTI